MPLSPGDTLPDATLLRLGENGRPEEVQLSELAAGRTLAIFALPGAYTGTCTTAHVPSFLRTADDFKAKGVDEIVCIAVNDPFVMDAWAQSTGAKGTITMLADPGADYTKAAGMAFTAPPVGFYDRSKRYAMIVKDGKVVTLQADDSPGTCDLSGGESLLETL